MTPGWLLSLAAAAALAAPDAPPAPPAGEGEAPAGVAPAPGPEPEPAPAPRRDDRRGERHALALGAHGMTFFSNEGSQYTFYSASLGYLGSFGSRGLFLHALALLPLQARQDGHVYDTSDYYRRRTGLDLLIGWQWRFIMGTGVELEAGPGLHTTLLYLPGKSGYRDFSALPMGLGGGAVLRFATGARYHGWPMVVGAYARGSFDLYDRLRSDDLSHGFTFSAGAIFGLGGSR